MRTIVGVLRGGPSSEYDISLQSGATVLQELDREKYDPRDIFISKSGEWHSGGIVKDPHQILRTIDVAFNVLHGEYGENGKLQQLFETHGVPYTGSRAFPSAIAFNKILTKRALLPHDVKMARHATLKQSSDTEKQIFDLFRTFPQPTIVKPSSAGSSVGVSLARSFEEFEGAVHNALQHSREALIEEFIKGREATVGVVDNFRGEQTYALLPVEIVPPSSSPFFDYNAKYSGATVELCPGNFSESEKNLLMDTAKKVHTALDLSHYSRSDFIVSPRGIYFLEVNPAAAIGLTKESLLPKALRAVGSKLSDFLDHVIELARGTNKNT